MPNLTKQSFQDFELIQKISRITNSSIILTIAFMIIMTVLILNLYIILYNSAAKILYITLLYIIKD